MSGVLELADVFEAQPLAASMQQVAWWEQRALKQGPAWEAPIR